jgi:hypothetical protein
MTETAIAEAVQVLTSSDKPESSHIVRVPPGEPDQTPQAYVLRARVEGFPVTALCGYTWVPTRRAEGLPLCSECHAIYSGNGFEGGLPDE